MDWSNIPWWAWALAAVVVVVGLRVKLHIMKSLLKRQEERSRSFADDE